jgi:hypothetical protein
MRTFFLAALASRDLVRRRRNAREPGGSWCADYSPRRWHQCGFHGYGQCAATVSGVGGICRPDPARPSYNYRRSRRL